jgi:hypothetical protein
VRAEKLSFFGTTRHSPFQTSEAASRVPPAAPADRTPPPACRCRRCLVFPTNSRAARLLVAGIVRAMSSSASVAAEEVGASRRGTRTNMDNKQIKAVYTIIEKPGDTAFWLKVGVAFLNRDGSWNLKLDALPVNGQLQMRDMPPREARDGSGDREAFHAPDHDLRESIGRAIA